MHDFPAEDHVVAVLSYGPKYGLPDKCFECEVPDSLIERGLVIRQPRSQRGLGWERWRYRLTETGRQLVETCRKNYKTWRRHRKGH